MNLTSPKGIPDLLPEDLIVWRHVETVLRETFLNANVREIRTPLLEYTELFERGVGEGTDIVNKEMFSFEKEGRQLTLRPENTAGVVRAYIQHGMDRWPKPVKLFYLGAMFRYERPQAGRQRQFHQAGVECFGVDTPQSDVAMILLAHDCFAKLGIETTLNINNVGCFECREDFRTQLKAKLEPLLPELCEDCNKRFHINPMRMLDCKIDTAIYQQPDMQAFLSQDSTCDACQTHFKTVLQLLTDLNLPATRNPLLVRGLDYYTRTVFEFTSNQLGSQNAVCGGGRYNGLVKSLGGQDTPAVGWALGMERLVSLVSMQKLSQLDFYVVSDDPQAALALARELQASGKSADCDLSGKAMGKQFALADKQHARTVLVLGETERAAGEVTLKTMATGTQETLSKDAFLTSLQACAVHA